MRTLILILSLLAARSVSAQVSDSGAFYTRPEMVKIASRVTHADECDSLLGLTTQQSLNKDSIILNDSLVHHNDSIASYKKDLIIQNREMVILHLETQQKVGKLTLVGLAVLNIILILKK